MKSTNLATPVAIGSNRLRLLCPSCVSDLLVRSDMDPSAPVLPVKSREGKRKRGHDAQWEKKRQRSTCGCQPDCAAGERIVLYNVDDDEDPALQCTCTCCGPRGEDGKRRCIVRLNEAGRAITLAIDRRMICFDCRGCE